MPRVGITIKQTTTVEVRAIIPAPSNSSACQNCRMHFPWYLSPRRFCYWCETDTPVHPARRSLDSSRSAILKPQQAKGNP